MSNKYLIFGWHYNGQNDNDKMHYVLQRSGSKIVTIMSCILELVFFVDFELVPIYVFPNILYMYILYLYLIVHRGQLWNLHDTDKDLRFWQINGLDENKIKESETKAVVLLFFSLMFGNGVDILPKKICFVFFVTLTSCLCKYMRTWEKRNEDWLTHCQWVKFNAKWKP